jgi:tetratricopeptide (TPR) repeat protein
MSVPVRLRLIALTVLATLGTGGFGAPAGGREAPWVEVRSPHFVVSSDAGEKQARRVADHFEQIRAVFHSAFPKLRVDPGQPILILAAKNESTMKSLVPADWEQKGHIHHTGFYIRGPEKHYVLIQLEGGGEHPYHTLYHEYTHALVDLNFRGLPLWLNEGLAEFYGNTTIGDKEIQVGRIDEGHLILLQQNKLLPIDVLLQVDHNSPHYNEQNRASVFYAESWAVVHYLMVEPEATKAGLLKNFLDAYDKTGDQAAAAAQGFGDLKKFIKRIDGYVRQMQFHYARMKTPAELADKDYAVRTISPAESAALRGDFLLHMNRPNEAKTLLDQALAIEPGLSAVHENLGYYYYRQNDTASAAREYAEAVRLDSHSYLALYFHAMLASQGGIVDAQKASEIKASLEKAVQLNANFAPAYSTLAFFYLMRSETREQAFRAAKRAAELEPGDLQYAISLGRVLLALNRREEAQILSARILKAAKTPAEAALAQSLQSSVENYREFSTRMSAQPAEEEASSEDSERPAPDSSTKHPPEGGTPTEPALKKRGQTAEGPSPNAPASPPSSAEPAAPVKLRTYSMMGRITEPSCGPPNEAVLTLSMSGITMRLHAADTVKIEYSVAGKKSSAAANPCAQWKGRSAQISYTLTPSGSYDGEITAIAFR